VAVIKVGYGKLIVALDFSTILFWSQLLIFLRSMLFPFLLEVVGSIFFKLYLFNKTMLEPKRFNI
jgi:hypothetical protein